jgi:hypothetical protein
MTSRLKSITIFAMALILSQASSGQEDCRKCDLNHWPVSPECEKCWSVEKGVINSVSENSLVLSSQEPTGKTTDHTFALDQDTKKNAPLKPGASATVFYRPGHKTADVVNLTEALEGLLKPGHQPDPPNICGQLPQEAIKVFLGNNLTWTMGNRMVGLDIGGEQLLVMDRTEKGVALSARIYDESGVIMAQLIDNRFYVNRNNTFRIDRRDPSSLAVYDLQAHEVLRVVYLNQYSIEVTGIFRNGPNRQTVIVSDDGMHVGGSFLSGNCIGGFGTAIKVG